MTSVAARLGRSRTRLYALPGAWLIVGSLLAVGVLAGVALAFAPARDLPRVLPTEDGFYALSVARHLGLGDGITADGVADTNGFQPLWSFLCAPLYALAGGDRILGLRLTQLLGTLLWLAFAALVAVYARDFARRHGLRGDVAAVTAVVVALGSVSVFRVFHNGLETGLLLVLVCAAVIALDRVRRWTPRRVVAVGVLLGAIAWARLDGAVFAVAAALAVVAGALRGRRRPPVAPLAACALAGLLLAPWLVYGLRLDGHLIPSGGRAEALGTPIVGRNAVATIRALGNWIFAPAFHPVLHPGSSADTWVGLAAIAVLLIAIGLFRRRVGRLRLGTGTAALWLYVAFLVAYYTIAQGAWWFQERYLSAALILAIPWLAGAVEALLPARAVYAIALVVAVLNLPLFGVLLAAPHAPPSWASPGANTATHPDLNWDQTTWALRHVRADCRVGAKETGTLLYFRPDTVNLDGKVNEAALAARSAGRLPAYVDRARVDVLLDIRSGVAAATHGHRREWGRARRIDRRFVLAIRRGRESCVH